MPASHVTRDTHLLLCIILCKAKRRHVQSRARCKAPLQGPATVHLAVRYGCAGTDRRLCVTRRLTSLTWLGQRSDAMENDCVAVSLYFVLAPRQTR